jgi:signal transduction histidine kinase
VPELSSWSVRRRLAIALSGLSAILLIVMVVAIIALISVRSQQRAVIDRYFTAVSVTNQRFTSQVDAETAIRGYALTNDRATLLPELSLRSASYADEVPRLVSLIGSDSGALAALKNWDTAAAQWYRQWAVPTTAEIDAGGGSSITPQEVLVGKALFDVNRTQYARFSNQLVERRNAASNALQVRTTLLFVAVLVLLLSMAFGGALTWWGLRRWILNPLGALGAETRFVRSGALDHPVVVPGPTEVQELASDVEGMRHALVEQLAAVEQASAEIDAARQQLETQAENLARSNRDLEQFAYVASHDLQEPLRKVASFCQLLESRYAGQLDERADQYIAFAVDGAKRMQQLINDLLAFSRVGRAERTMADVDLQACLDGAAGNLAIGVEEADATLTADPLPHVPGDATLLTQLLQNMIANAIKFRSDEPPQIHITAQDHGDHWEFACSDNGLGIEPQYADRIFVIFQRLHSKDTYSGTGIGLALCKRIVEHHGGQIWLDTTVTRGATFRWTLPTSTALPTPKVGTQ